MKGRAIRLLAAAAAIAVSGSLAAQQSLLPPGFDDKSGAEPARAPAPRPLSAATPRATTSAPRASTPAAVAAPQAVATTSSPVVQPLPTDTGATPPPAARADPLAGIDPALIDELVEKVRPKYDIPPDAQRSLATVGLVAQADGGLPATSSHYLNGRFVEGVLGATRGPLVSRWGHILLRRALVSRLDTPVGMNGADWAAIRAQVLLRMGEADAARALVQQVDSGNFTRSLEDAAMGSFLATADPVGLCPISALTAAGRTGWDWSLTRAICSAFTGDGPPALSQLDLAMRRRGGSLPSGDKIDILLAQKFAGSGTNARRAVQIEWKDVDKLTPWRSGLALATGIEPPEALRKPAGSDYDMVAVRAPMLPLAARAAAAEVAAGRGILSSAAMIDLWSQIAAFDADDATWGPQTALLRNAYVSPDAADRLAAIKSLWSEAGDPDRAYSRLVLTAYAAARIVPNAAMTDDAAGLVSSMLTAGLDRNAARWTPFTPVGSEAWGILAVASPNKLAAIGADQLGQFKDGDSSSGAIRSRFLLAGLMGLGRVDADTARAFARSLSLDMARETRWTRAIDAAADSDNPALVAMLAGFGMQGAGWDKMTAVHLYHIVSALRRVGFEGEARMIAAEAISRV
ncbi:hypothetical protein [Novosphingobium huizhouense]|uniref:hypothetical protein n=1 Tax=Novosphingobium huizhouense TaxID=2866625 RepID=UPI001CD877AF|nr:hypothetical protein [Novosphingobium huizhouense]